jgi:hypothetical protein
VTNLPEVICQGEANSITLAVVPALCLENPASHDPCRHEFLGEIGEDQAVYHDSKRRLANGKAFLTLPMTGRATRRAGSPHLN